MSGGVESLNSKGSFESTQDGPNLVAVDQKLVVFDIEQSPNASQLISLQSLSKKPISWRIQTNAPTRYIVCPNGGVLSSHEPQKILIELVGNGFNPQHRLVLQATVVDSEKQAEEEMNKVMDSSSTRREKDRCLFGKLHINHGMRLIVAVGTVVLICLVCLLYMKFRRSMFILLLPTAITVITAFAIISKKERLIWPIIAVSFFHAMLALYVLLVFSFYFFFKPLYIIMVLNWAFNTLYSEKTLSYYVQCGGIYLFLSAFLAFNLWQSSVSLSYRKLLKREMVPSRQPTVLVVNKPGMTMY